MDKDKQPARSVIEKLLIIQERDCELARCRRELLDIPSLQKAANGLLDKHNVSIAGAKDAVKASLVTLKQREIEIDTLRQQVSKLREQQFQIKSNEEFKVLNREIAAQQEKVRLLEDNAIALMEASEKAKQEEESMKAALARAQEEVKSELQRLEERRKNLENEQGRLQAERKVLAADIPEDWMVHYDRVMENRKDVALVGVANNCCNGCQMKLPPHILQDAKRAEAIVNCTFCGRLLYWA